MVIGNIVMIIMLEYAAAQAFSKELMLDDTVARNEILIV